VKIEQALVLYLLKHKQISLQGIGTFKIEGPIPENTDNDRPVIIPAESISFIYDPKVKEDNELIDFIVQNTKKIKPLASADLDSFLTLGRQFLNIGKPFTIQNLGTLEKLKSGDLEFKPGPLVQRVEVPKPKIEDEGAEKHEENLFNDYQREPSFNNSRILLIGIIIVLLALGSWAAWHYGFKNDNTEPAATSDNIVPIVDSINTSQKQKDDSLAQARRIADSLSNIQKNPADSFSFKIVVRETKSKDVALATLQHLKNYGRNVIMYTDDSITYKVAHPFMLPLSDTSRILDSLNKNYYRGKAYIEIK
jgi:nucleoid DNA-binding protein